MSVSLSLKVNGQPVSADVDPRTLLSDFLRVNLGLTGTHIGCDTAQCGACTVHLGGRAIKSCNILAVQAQGADVLTIEGLAAADGARGQCLVSMMVPTGCLVLFPVLLRPAPTAQAA